MRTATQGDKPADWPAVTVAANAARPGLVRFAIGSSTTGFDITPDNARHIADALVEAADDAACE